MSFSYEIDELLVLFKTRKDNLVRFLINNFKENIHYIKTSIDKTSIDYKPKGSAGRNKEKYLVTENTFNLIKSTFKMRSRYIVQNEHVNQINIIMSIENQTIGFIENTFKNIIKCERQFRFENYKVDLYFPDNKLVIECDELGHNDRDILYEQERQIFIESFGNTFIRFNPNEKNFDLSIILNKIIKFLFKNIEKE